jgi:hypothetical protein
MILSIYTLLLIALLLGKIQSETSSSSFSQYLIQQVAGGILQQSSTSYRFGSTKSTKADSYITLYDSKLQFKSYSPEIFRVLRKAAGVDEKEFLQSLCVENMDCLTNTDSKSGQMFWKSKDGKLLIKTIKKYECKTLRRILPALQHHVLDNSVEIDLLPEQSLESNDLVSASSLKQTVQCSSLLNNLLGLYRIRIPSSRTTKYCLICKNIYPEEILISSEYTQSHEQYDLKGSLVGRKKNVKSLVYKDQDFLQQAKGLRLGVYNKAIFLAQLKKDCQFLQRHGLMDYSLLVYAESLIPIESTESRLAGDIISSDTRSLPLSDKKELEELLARRLCLSTTPFSTLSSSGSSFQHMTMSQAICDQ